MNFGFQLDNDTFKILESGVTFELKENKSRFICHAEPITTREEAEVFIQQMRQHYHDATHNCFAFRIGTGRDEITRFSDDGEPSGTAGKPILAAIIGHELTNVIVIVTRYFGGIKLGTGGLVRAYGRVTAETLSRASVKQQFITIVVEIKCPYPVLSAVMHGIELYHGEIVRSDYLENVHMDIRIRRQKLSNFNQFIIDHTSGKVKPKVKKSV